MLIKKYLKKAGRWLMFLDFSALDSASEPKSVLVVWLTHGVHLKQIVGDIKKKLPNSNVYVLTGEGNRDFIETEMPDCELILPAVNTKRFRYARQLFRFRKESFDAIVLTKLDISVVFIAIYYFRIPVYLSNVWREWYRVRLRRVSEIFMLSDDTMQQRSVGLIKGNKGYFFINLYRLAYSFIAHIGLFIKVTFLLIRNLLRTIFQR